MTQRIQVDALGRPLCEYREDAAITLDGLGAQTIQRFSVIHHDEASQRFYVEFRETAPKRVGSHMTPAHCETMCPALWASDGLPACVDVGGGQMTMATWPTYALAVAAERAIIAYLMDHGGIHV